jgi:hypothetical protein
MNTYKFVTFIISHGRADNVRTLKTLAKCGYTLPWYIVIDNEDKTAEKYIHNFGKEKILIFDKKAIADQTDEGNNFDNRRTTTHARNACFDLAMSLGYDYFLVLDDDYTNFRYRMIDEKYCTKGYVNNLNRLCLSMVNFLHNTNITSVAFAQGGDFIGGAGCGLLSNYTYQSRKCMNSFFCSVNRRFWFVGQLNEDVNTYITLGRKGSIFFTIPYVGIEQASTQKTKGGMTDAYIKFGTYVKSFTTAMFEPSCARVSMMGVSTRRLHHKILWSNATPMIIDEKYKK